MEDNGGCCLPCINSKSMFSPIYDILSLSKMKTPMLSSDQWCQGHNICSFRPSRFQNL